MQRPIIRTFIFGALLCFLNAQNDPFVLDSSLSAVINQSLANDIQVADVDNDGYNDIIYSGYDSSRFGLFIDVYLSSNEGTLSQGYQTNFITYPDTIGEYIGGIGNIDLSDVNLDGYIDIYLNGSAKSKLLFNNSIGSISLNTKNALSKFYNTDNIEVTTNIYEK